MHAAWNRTWVNDYNRQRQRSRQRITIVRLRFRSSETKNSKRLVVEWMKTELNFTYAQNYESKSIGCSPHYWQSCSIAARWNVVMQCCRGHIDSGWSTYARLAVAIRLADFSGKRKVIRSKLWRRNELFQCVLFCWQYLPTNESSRYPWTRKIHKIRNKINSFLSNGERVLRRQCCCSIKLATPCPMKYIVVIKSASPLLLFSLSFFISIVSSAQHFLSNRIHLFCFVSAIAAIYHFGILCLWIDSSRLVWTPISGFSLEKHFFSFCICCYLCTIETPVVTTCIRLKFKDYLYWIRSASQNWRLHVSMNLWRHSSGDPWECRYATHACNYNRKMSRNIYVSSHFLLKRGWLIGKK